MPGVSGKQLEPRRRVRRGERDQAELGDRDLRGQAGADQQPELIADRDRGDDRELLAADGDLRSGAGMPGWAWPPARGRRLRRRRAGRARRSAGGAGAPGRPPGSRARAGPASRSAGVSRPSARGERSGGHGALNDMAAALLDASLVLCSASSRSATCAPAGAGRAARSPARCWRWRLCALSDPAGLPARLAGGRRRGGFLLAAAVIRPDGMGLGDVKLAGVLGVYLGAAVIEAMVVAFAAGSVVGTGAARPPRLGGPQPDDPLRAVPRSRRAGRDRAPTLGRATARPWPGALHLRWRRDFEVHDSRRIARPRAGRDRRGPAGRARARPERARSRHGAPPARPRARRPDEDRERRGRDPLRGPARAHPRQPDRGAGRQPRLPELGRADEPLAGGRGGRGDPPAAARPRRPRRAAEVRLHATSATCSSAPARARPPRAWPPGSIAKGFLDARRRRGPQPRDPDRLGERARSATTSAPRTSTGVDDSPVRCLDAGRPRRRWSRRSTACGRRTSRSAASSRCAPSASSRASARTSSWSEKLDGRLAQAVCSIQSVKGVSLGEAWDVAGRPGSEAHDEIFYSEERGWYRETNRAGGLEGGMTNGEPLVVQAAIKPISTMTQPLRSVDTETKEPAQAMRERTDSTVVPAAASSPRRWSPWCWPAPTARSSAATTSTTSWRRSPPTRSGSDGGGSPAHAAGDRLHRVHGRGQERGRPRPPPSGSGSG